MKGFVSTSGRSVDSGVDLSYPASRMVILTHLDVFGSARILILAIIVAAFSCPQFSAHASELVENGLFAKGTGGRPKGWRHEAYLPGPDAVIFAWTTEASGVGVLKISNLKQNDSRWRQSFSVSPSKWYRVSGWIRTENVGTQVAGAYLAEMNNDYYSDDVRGSHDWQPVEFWMKTGPVQKRAELACRLGGYSALNTGTAYFTGISVVQTRTPPDTSERIFSASFWDFPGQHLVSIWGTIIAVCIIFLLGLFLRHASP